jgi:hypothetical protein
LINRGVMPPIKLVTKPSTTIALPKLVNPPVYRNLCLMSNSHSEWSHLVSCPADAWRCDGLLVTQAAFGLASFKSPDNSFCPN